MYGFIPMIGSFIFGLYLIDKRHEANNRTK